MQPPEAAAESPATDASRTLARPVEVMERPWTTVFPSILETRSAAGLAQRPSRHHDNRWIT
jgi:hypothetical protein